jgi:hypothetical protein
MEKCYVYVLMDSSIKMDWQFNNKKFYYKPFYIGMGKDYRINYHGTISDLASTKNTFKKEYIMNLNILGYDIIREKIVENLLPEEACKIEIELIKKFGRIINNSGILTNISKGGELFTYGSDHPNATSVYQYSLDGIFIKEYLSIVDISIDNLKYVSNRISNCSNKNEKNYPEKIHNACGYIWFKDYKGESIKQTIDDNDTRIYQYTIDFKLINIYKGAIELNKKGYSDSSVYRAMDLKYLYKNSFWSKGKIKNKNLYRKRINNCKKCFQYTIEGDFIKEHDCVQDIPSSEKINITPDSIAECCRLNKEKYPLKTYKSAGFVWMYNFEGNKLIKK